MGIVESLRKKAANGMVHDKHTRLTMSEAASLLERAGKMLKEVQWDPCCIQCPICRGRDSAGHAPDCELAAILKELE